MKNIKRTLWIAIVVGAFTLSAFAVDLVPTSESLLQKVEKKERSTDRIAPGCQVGCDFKICRLRY